MRKHMGKKHVYQFIVTALFFSLMLTSASTLAAEVDAPFSLQEITIGMSEQEVLEKLGQPGRVDLSEYGFNWYIYNQDYARYIQVGIANGKVVALYTNAADWLIGKGIGFGSTKAEVEQAYGSPLTQIKKGNIIFNYSDSGKEYGIYLVDGIFLTIFYDLHQNNIVTAIQLIDQVTELSFTQFHGEPSEELRSSFEKQVFDLANAVRVRSGINPLEWNDSVALTARKHSADMAARNFFEHYNPEGRSPFDRLKADGIVYKLASENIAAGQTNAIYAHESWMNSLGHRQNILGEYSHLGVGISFGGSFHVYYTQNFYKPHS